ncbi:myosin-16-like [Macrosteles quadrilineatus]|uniref:myosin-16-like n=1 Tax=Macrosteles quadrilineatus TaxID=74068 RepID=UPI0023E2D7F8|nr:myosin-16-like [Macrosteles quadrilineatus]
MDGSPCVTLLNGAEINFNSNDQHEDDEEDIEEENMRKEMLKAQLEHAFDDCWNESDHEEDSGNSSSSDDEGGHRKHQRAQLVPPFRKLSSISERSPNKTVDSENSLSQSRFVFSPPKMSFESTENGEDNPPMNGQGDGESRHKQVLKNKLTSENNIQFKPIFSNGSLSEKSHTSINENGDSYTESVTNGHTNENQPYVPVFNNPTMENGDKFQHNNSNSEVSHESIDDIAEAYRQAEYNSVDQLRVLYEVRMREIQELQAEKLRAANHQQEMMRRLALMEAEKQRAVLSRTEASKLLVACKEEIGNLQKELDSQKQTITSLEKDKAKSDDTAEVLRIHVQELEQRIELMERFDSNKTAAKHTEAIIKDLRTKQQQEMKLVQKEMDCLRTKLLKKEEECRELERRVVEQQKTQEQLLVDKAETINQLARRLEESQSQCGQLMSANVTVENVKLQNQLGQVLREKEELSQTVRNLQAECSIMRSDLTQYESLSRLTQPHSNSSSDDTDSITQLGISSRSRHTNLNTTDMVTKLKDELHRALLNQKAKRSEILRLQETIQHRDREIREMRDQERVYMAEIETMKEQLNNMMMEIRSVKNQKEAEKDTNNKSKSEEILQLNAQVAELNKEKAVIEREKLEVKKKLDELTKEFEEEKKKEISENNKEYLKFHDEIVSKVRKEMEQEAELRIKEYSVRLEQSLKEVNDVKDVCAAKEEMALQLQKLSAEKDRSGDREEERDRLKKELKEYMDMRDHLARRVNTAERENAKLATEMDKLKTELENKILRNEENQVCPECARLQEELSNMSVRHTNELTTARSQLQAARDRLLQLEKTARQQFDTEIKSLRQDRDSLKTKCDEKENQIKKLIESRKRTPTTTSCATQTDVTFVGQTTEDKGVLEGVEKRLREEFEHNLAVLEKAHQEAVVASRNQHKHEIERLQQEHQRMLEAEAQLRASHQRALQEVEERTKQVTLEFCAAQIRRLEEQYMEEACRRADPSVVGALQTALQERVGEVKKLKERLASLQDEHQKQLATLQQQIEADRNRTTQLMVQWSQELKNAQGEVKLKEAIIDDQSSKIQKAKAKVQKLRNQLITTNQNIEAEYTSKCNQYKAEFIKVMEEHEKTVNEQVKQLREAYQNQVRELKKELRKKKSTEKIV